MIRKSTLTIFAFMIFLMMSVPVLAQSNTSEQYDDRRDIGKNSRPNSQTGAEMQNNPAIVNPRDPSGVNSNTPRSPRAAPSSGAPGMNSGSQSNVTPPSGH